MNKVSLSNCKVALLALGLSAAPLAADSLWKDDAAQPMFADKRAAAVGDIITILVQENNATTKEASTKTAKKSGVDAGVQTFLYSPAASGLLTKGGQMPALKFSSKNDFEGGGQINNSEKITARIAVRVVDVLPNKNLVIEGKRQTAFAGEIQDVVLRGVVRAADVSANNTVYSFNVADATLTFTSKGSVSNTQKKGWFTKVWDKVSPF